MIIFLDIDGVLTSTRCESSHRGSHRYWSKFDPVAMAFLAKVCNDYNATIVISSHWRTMHDKGFFQVVFDNCGFPELGNALHDEWATPILAINTAGNFGQGICRGEEIEAWFKKTGEKEEYMIIDDEAEFLDYQQDRVVRTSTNDGMLFANFQQINKMLSQEIIIKDNRNVTE